MGVEYYVLFVLNRANRFRRKFEITSSRYGVYVLGFKFATIVITKWKQKYINWSKSLKIILVQIVFLLGFFFFIKSYKK